MENLNNRELSWLEFNERVLQEAQDKSNPLIERIRFLGIYSNNLDEFYRVRVATQDRLYSLSGNEHKIEEAKEVLKAISRTVMSQQAVVEETTRQILREAARSHILLVDENFLSEEDKAFLEDFFVAKVRPVLIPIILDNPRKLSKIKDAGVFLAVKMKAKKSEDEATYAYLEIPSSLPRFVILPKNTERHKLIFLDDVIRLQLSRVFKQFEFDYIETHTFKITRDAELDIEDNVAESLIDKLEKGLKRRKKGFPVRFVYDKAMPEDMLEVLIKGLKLKRQDSIIPGGKYHNFKDFMSFPSFGKKKLSFKPQPPVLYKELSGVKSVIAKIKEKDALLYYPYHSFSHIIDLLREAAIDPKTKKIYVNIYRLASNSQIANALISAARNGKTVKVNIELGARFDEQNNIEWSNAFQEEENIQVLLGVPRIKVHSKLILIEQRDGTMISHVGTGNFNEKTAKIYTDYSLLTADPEIGKEIKDVFEIFENHLLRPDFKHLFVSPFNTRSSFLDLINSEIKAAKSGEKAWIILKLNNLADAELIKKLYEASKAGVKVELIVRGICKLIPGKKGLSENINARSIVGRYLEHTRVAVFYSGGAEKTFISSADWMTRNLDKRIEVTTQVYDKKLKKEIATHLEVLLEDNQKARSLNEGKVNHYLVSQGKPFNAQQEMYKYIQHKEQ